MVTIATVVSNVPSSDNDDDSVSVAVISGAIIGTLLLIIIIIVIVIVMILTIKFCGRRKKGTLTVCNIDDNVPNLQQHTYSTSQHTDSGTSKLQTVNTLYVPTQVKSVNSSLQHNYAIINVGPNSSETGKECEHQYDYIQSDDGSVQHDKVVGGTTSRGEYDEVIDPADNVNIDPNPSYALPQDVKLEDNPSYTQLLAS